MAKRATIEERIAALEALREASPNQDETKLLLKGLASKVGLIVEAAASVLQTIGGIDDTVESAMAAAFETLSTDGGKRDPLCRGKLAIAVALHARGVFLESVFQSGVSLVQKEPIWGGQQDTAADLRARCGLAHAELYQPDAVNVLATLLADPERSARAGAAHALGNSARLEAIPLLRFKVLVGDDDIEVLSAAMRALLVLDPESTVEFLGQFLEGDSAAAEAAALCMGESRLAESFSMLREWANHHNLVVGFLAIALLRSTTSERFLLDAIESGEDEACGAAKKALAAFTHDAALAERVEAAVRARALR